ncbi:Ribonuclease PH [compost metagenome]
MNLVMTGSGKFVELQGTGEDSPFDRKELEEMLTLGENGILQLIERQKEVLGPIALKIGSRQAGVNA